MSEWRDIEKTPAPLHTWVLTWSRSASFWEIGMLEADGLWHNGSEEVYGDPPFAKVTHWMPIPSPPSGDEKQP